MENDNMQTNETLTEAFAKAGEKHGYEDIQAEFVAFKDFKVKWSRSYRWISFFVSDYLQDAPESVLESIADTLFIRIGGDMATDYSDEVTAWLTSDDFVRVHQPVFTRRMRGLSDTGRGEVHDLAESYDRLVSAGLVERGPLVRLGWYNPTGTGRTDNASVLMRTVAMSRELDSRKVPAEVLDFALYGQLAHIALGFRPGRAVYCPEYDDLLNLHPDRARMEEELSARNLSI